MRVGPVQCGCAAAIRAFLPRPPFSNSPPHLRQAGVPVLLRSQGRRSAAARRVLPTTRRSCRRVPPAAEGAIEAAVPIGPLANSQANHPQPEPPRHWPPSRSHNPRQAGATIPVMPVPLPPSSRCHYWKAKTNTIAQNTDAFFSCCFRVGFFAWGISR